MKPLDVVRTFGIFLMETAQKDQMIKQNLPMYTITTTLGSEIRLSRSLVPEKFVLRSHESGLW